MITAPFLDEVIAYIDTRFSDSQKKTFQGMSSVPSVLIVNMSASNSYASLTKDLAELDADDLPSPLYLEHEVHIWHRKWSNGSDKIPATPSEALLYMQMKRCFPILIVYFVSYAPFPSRNVNARGVFAYLDA